MRRPLPVLPHRDHPGRPIVGRRPPPAAVEAALRRIRLHLGPLGPLIPPGLLPLLVLPHHHGLPTRYSSLMTTSRKAAATFLVPVVPCRQAHRAPRLIPAQTRPSLVHHHQLLLRLGWTTTCTSNNNHAWSGTVCNSNWKNPNKLWPTEGPERTTQCNHPGGPILLRRHPHHSVGPFSANGHRGPLHTFQTTMMMMTKVSRMRAIVTITMSWWHSKRIRNRQRPMLIVLPELPPPLPLRWHRHHQNHHHHCRPPRRWCHLSETTE